MAQPAPTLITQDSAGSSSSQATASFTPVAGKLYVVACTARRNSPAPSAGIISATHPGGLILVSEAQSELSGPNRLHCSFRGLKNSGLSAGAITFTITGGAWDAISWDVLEYDAVDTTGTDGSAAVTFGTAVSENGASSPATGTVPTPTANDTCAYSIGTEDDAAITGPSSGFTNVADVTGSDTNTRVDYNTDGITDVAVTLGSPRGWAVHPYRVNGVSSAVAIAQTDIGQTRNRPGRSPYSLGQYFRPSIDAFVTGNKVISVPLATITLDAQAPTVTATANNFIAVPVASITLDGKVPAVTATANNLIAIPVGSLTLDAFAPTVQNGANQSVAVPKASVTLDAFAPTISKTANQTVAVPVASITIDGFVPTVTATANNLIAVPLATMSLNAIAPSVQASGPNVIDVPLAAISITVYAPDVINSSPDGSRRGGIRSKKSFDEARKYSDRIRKQLDDVLEDVSEIYRELIDGPQIFAKEAAQIVKPFAAPKAKTIPQPAIIDWKALERDSERVGKLVSLWLKQQRRLEMLHADDEWMMLGD